MGEEPAEDVLVGRPAREGRAHEEDDQGQHDDHRPPRGRVGGRKVPEDPDHQFDRDAQLQEVEHALLEDPPVLSKEAAGPEQHEAVRERDGKDVRGEAPAGARLPPDEEAGQRMNASKAEPGSPTSALRRSARLTWSVHATRTRALTGFGII